MIIIECNGTVAEQLLANDLMKHKGIKVTIVKEATKMKFEELSEAVSRSTKLKVAAIVYDVKGKLVSVLQAQVPVYSKLVLESDAKKIILDLESKLKKANDALKAKKNESAT